ncbi:glycosyltransferase [Weissella cibaria]|nr:glycosyltransferase [Weissella cibaria]
MNPSTRNHIWKVTGPEMLFAYIILNFRTSDITVQSVENITSTVLGDYKIIIVDNNSNDGTAEKLQELSDSHSNIHVLFLDKNVGFAEGNNAGISYAKQFNPDYFVVMNNDAEIVQPNFQDKVSKSFADNAVGIIGPDIVVKNTNVHQNPKRHEPISEGEARRKLAASSKLMSYSDRYLATREWFKSNKWLKNTVRVAKDRISGSRKKADYDISEIGNLILHGSFFVISSAAVVKLGTVFDRRTFFYMEMEILSLRLKSLGIKSKYDNSIKVFHMQNASTNATFHSRIKKIRFQGNQMKESTAVYLKVLEELGELGDVEEG